MPTLQDVLNSGSSAAAIAAEIEARRISNMFESYLNATSAETQPEVVPNVPTSPRVGRPRQTPLAPNVPTNAAAIENIEYPEEELNNTIYVYRAETIRHGWYFKYRGQCSQNYANFAQIHTDVLRQLSNSMGRERGQFYVYPEIGNTDWVNLSRPRNVEGSFPYAFYIVPSPTRRRFKLIAPSSRTNGMYGEDTGATLADVYLKARIMVRTLKQECPINENGERIRWEIRPLKNTPEYQELLNFAQRHGIVDYGIIEENDIEESDSIPLNNFRDISNALNIICHDITSPLVENTSANIIKYLIDREWTARNEDYDEDGGNYEGIREDKKELVRSIIYRRTGVRMLDCWDDEFRLVHPNNMHVANIEEEGENTLQQVSSTYFTNHCRNCDGCNQGFIRDGIRRISRESDTRMCVSCLEERGYFRCQHCSGEYHNEEDGCPHYNNMPAETIYGYSQDVRSVIPRMFHTASDKPKNGNYLRYGLELEVLIKDNVEFNHAARMTGEAIRGHAIMKRDSSIGDNGFEIVTAPATLEYHRKVLWNKWFTNQDRNGATAASLTRSWNTACCGLHVHITRAALDAMQLSKLLYFYHDERNGQFLSHIAGRTVGRDARYCKTGTKRLGTNTPNNCQDHHEAITISRRNNGKTAEVRIFRGNATKHGIMRCLEFVDATVHWCSVASASQLNYRYFLQWFDAPTVRSRYPELWRYLIQRGYIRTEHKSKGKKTFDMLPESEMVA